MPGRRQGEGVDVVSGLVDPHRGTVRSVKDEGCGIRIAPIDRCNVEEQPVASGPDERECLKPTANRPLHILTDRDRFHSLENELVVRQVTEQCRALIDGDRILAGFRSDQTRNVGRPRTADDVALWVVDGHGPVDNILCEWCQQMEVELFPGGGFKRVQIPSTWGGEVAGYHRVRSDCHGAGDRGVCDLECIGG